MNDTQHVRLSIFRMVVFGTLGLLVLTLYYVQVLRGSYYRQLSERNRIRLIRVEAPRGGIYDRNGVPLAKTRPSIDVFVVPEDFDLRDIPFLARALGLSHEGVEEKVSRPGDVPFMPVLVRRDVSKEVLFRLEERRPALEGVFAEVQGLRYYPEGGVASHILGYLGKITREEYQAQKEEIYHLNAWVGRSGVERIFDRSLRGEDGGRQVEVNVRGRPIRVLGEKEPEAGSNLYLTLDARLQRLADEVLGLRKGAVCVLDPGQGDLLALLSKPGFDPNVFVSPAHSAERLKILADRTDFPMLDRAVGAGFPPGSVFKIVTALAALETKKISPDTPFFCHGSYRLNPRSRPFKCWRPSGHGALNLRQAIERSCNVYFYQVGQRTGVKDLARFSRMLGLGGEVPLELSHVSEGVIPDEEWKRIHFRDDWYQGETLNFAIGQGFVLTTPLQVARVVATIAKDGLMPEPEIVIRPGPLKTPRRLPVNPENLRLIKEAMLQVVQSSNGTGQLARVDFLRMAAKTGTAQVPAREPHSWFAGFFPYEDPRFVLVVFVEHGGPGGFHAARLAKQMVLGMKDLGFFGGENAGASGVTEGVVRT